MEGVLFFVGSGCPYMGLPFQGLDDHPSTATSRDEEPSRPDIGKWDRLTASSVYDRDHTKRAGIFAAIAGVAALERAGCARAVGAWLRPNSPEAALASAWRAKATPGERCQVVGVTARSRARFAADALQNLLGPPAFLPPADLR